MTKDTFGESLKRERELRGVSLDEISAATRIATRFLRAIEDGKWDQLPGGVFNRGFVRAIARYRGLDEENTVAEYTLAVGDRQTVPVWSGSPPKVAPEQPWLAWIIAAVVILAFLVGGWFGARRFLLRRLAKRAAQTTAIGGVPAPPLTNPPQRTASAPPPASGAAAPSNPPAGAPTVPSDPPPTTAANLPTPDPFELTIEALNKTSVTVVADKDVVFDATMKAGEKRKFSAMDHFQVSTKDGGALNLGVNGRVLPPIGPPGQEGKVTLTREIIKGAAGGRN